MSSADRRRAFPPNVEWSIQHDGILEELVYGDYVANGPPKTHRDVDPSLKKPYLTEELFCSMAGGWTTYELIEAYKSTDVAATEARRARDTAQRERMEAQSASQAAYRENQEVSQAALWAEQDRLHAQNAINLAAATVYTDGRRGKSSGEKRTEASSTLGGQQFGPGATPNFGTDEFGNEWGDLKSGEASYLGRMDNQDEGNQPSQPGDTEATGSTSEKKPKNPNWVQSLFSRRSRGDQA